MGSGQNRLSWILIDDGCHLIDFTAMSLSAIPSPYYSIFNTSRGDDPAVVVVDGALRQLGEKNQYPWHLELVIECLMLAENGMPTREEVGIIEDLEDAISASLTHEGNARFLARVTCQGKRELTYRVQEPEIADAVLKRCVALPVSVREWEYWMNHDAAWQLAKPVFKLFERASGLN